MREIKYRAWNTDDEMMYPVLSIDFEEGTCEADGDGLELTWRDEIRSVPEAILMQFTGLKDKYGKEIWEGDIVHCEDEMYAGATEMAKRFSTNENHAISFEDGAFRFDEITLGDMINPGAHPLVFEIIGNIYENADLLTTSAPASSGAAEQATG